MRGLWVILGLAACSQMLAGAVVLEVDAPDHAGKEALVFRYADLITRRTELVAHATVPPSGEVAFEFQVPEIGRYQLRIDAVTAEIFLQPDGRYHLFFPLPAADQARSVSGSARVHPEFFGLDPFDVNALVSDLNYRLDAFQSELYGATLLRDPSQIHKAILERENGKAKVDTLRVKRSGIAARIDTFEHKMQRAYADVDHPWFKQHMEYAIAELRMTPEHARRTLHDRYIKDRPVRYTDPAFMQFFLDLYANELLTGPFIKHADRMVQLIEAGTDVQALKTLLLEGDLVTDDRTAELILLNGLYEQHSGGLFDATGCIALIGQIEQTSTYSEHQAIATNMLWDLTAMRKGDYFPVMRLTDLKGDPVALDSLLHGYTYLMVTAAWCTYCAQELGAMADLEKEYGRHVNFVVVSMDSSQSATRKMGAGVPQIAEHIYHGTDDPLVLDRLRIRALPAFYVLEDRQLMQAPAKAPSQGIGATFHRIRTDAAKGERIKVWDD